MLISISYILKEDAILSSPTILDFFRVAHVEC